VTITNLMLSDKWRSDALKAAESAPEAQEKTEEK